MVLEAILNGVHTYFQRKRKRQGVERHEAQCLIYISYFIAN